ncbi:hypothetical protein SARC_12052 [Sphaeroforma arctica JP610]|uniref:Uncharacterized protein n=1 Tax=Sphaeroforma arctica JP610 TaxID=667725 RepID=A0A0L0FG28_9EUKA|nr:hypothetical protein SARC_12052 [Sphaeroforma arctica JP610]KNC75421.1 hypothetical protein SARC_12052 [Sphaeroforma arctica JP610]|eukprot:XP_014149323.1 hypothetical protein SARC_12052 [Sphaeroforma arctica JP610]
MIKDWLRREIEESDDSPHAWLHLVRIYNATRSSVTGFSPYFHMTGRNFNGQKRLGLQDRVLSLLESEKGTEDMGFDAVAAVRDRRAQLEQQSRVNIKREDVPLLPVGSQVWYRLRGKSYDLFARWDGPAKVVSVQALLTHVVEMADVTHRKFLRAELKPHVGKLTKEAIANADGYKQAVGHCLRRTKKARTWSDVMSSVWGRWQMWCDEAAMECYTPLAPGPRTKHVSP